MALSISSLISTAVPADFQAKLLSGAASIGLTTTSWQPGSVTRTAIAIFAQVLANGFGVSTTQQIQSSGSDGILSQFVQGGFLKFASAVTPDPSISTGLLSGVAQYPPVGTGWLDVVASELYNVKRADPTGTGNGGPAAQSNASLVAACLAKLVPLGPTFATGGVNAGSPYVYYATTGYAGAALTAPVTRATTIVTPLTVNLYVANAAGPAPTADVQAVHNFIQAGLVSVGETAIVRPAVAVNVTTAVTVYVPARYYSQATADVQAAVQAYFASIPIGGSPGAVAGSGVLVSALIAGIISRVPYVQDVESVLLNGLAADVAMTSTQVAVATPSTVVTVVST
ncbi:MAG: hypothetical protein NVS3B10_00030 [Polyangiales bacterium]